MFAIVVLVAAGMLAIQAGSVPAQALDWQQVAFAGINDAKYHTVDSMAVYNAGSGNRLYIGTGEGADPGGGCLVYGYDGSAWSAVSQKGFGDDNNRYATCMAVNDGKLYVGYGQCPRQCGCEVWSYDGGTWIQANPDGFGDSDNKTCTSMAVHGGKLYVGTYNLSGCQVWKFDGPGAANWVKAAEGGFSSDTENNYCSSMVVYDGNLYAGTRRNDSSSGCEVYRYGDTPLSWTRVNTDGFGTQYNYAAGSMAVLAGKLYAGTYNRNEGAQVLRYNSGTSWTRVSTAFGDPEDPEYEIRSMAVWQSKLYAGTASEGISKAMVYSYDGSAWTLESEPGFEGYPGAEDRDNRGVLSMAPYDPGTGARLFAGTHGEHFGFEVWGSGGGGIPGSHFYFAEGYTGAGFDE